VVLSLLVDIIASNRIVSSFFFLQVSFNSNLKSDYGQFFLNWYSQTLISHGERILKSIRTLSSTNLIFSFLPSLPSLLPFLPSLLSFQFIHPLVPRSVTISTKISGIHWQFQTPHHGAELTAGYKNDKYRPTFISSSRPSSLPHSLLDRGRAYFVIADMLAKYNVAFDFTCFEMKDSEQPGYACSSPENLVGLTLDSVKGKSIIFLLTRNIIIVS
jgi:beta-amylase